MVTSKPAGTSNNAPSTGTGASPPTSAALADTLSKNIALAARVSAVICLVGRRCHDRFVAPKEGASSTTRITTVEGMVHQTLQASGQWLFDPSDGTVSLFRLQEGAETGKLPKTPGERVKRALSQVLTEFAAMPATDAAKPHVLLIDAHLLFEDPAAPRDHFFQDLQLLESLSRTLPPGMLLALRCQVPADLPTALTKAPRVKVINIPETDRDERQAYAMLRAAALAQACQTTPEDLARVVSGCSEDWALDQLDALLNVAQAQGVNRLQDLEELATAVALGTTHSPWAGQMIRTAVRQAPEQLSQRVLGQPQAIQAVVSRLRQSVSGLSGAHQSRSSQAPRTTFFFAGPTGTGKTEIAKATSEVVYGQEQVLRFDCGELREEHAVSRLIGAPPGYVGHDSGGELTEGIRKKPNSLVLMDEIEKAAPRLLDTFLGVLDDGRLTSGQGHTAYFGQSMIAFTSNLGMYEEVRLDDGSVTRRARFGYDTPFEELQVAVRNAVRDEFVNRLGRPELLGRLGGAQNIIVFDFLRDLPGVTRKFLRNVAARCASNHNMHLSVNDDLVEHIAASARNDPEALLLGGRGLAQHLERILVLPLCDFIFDAEPTGRAVKAEMGADGARFTIS
jgi:ATP-dependent Clp protease ATP-binding subunit ClpB